MQSLSLSLHLSLSLVILFACLPCFHASPVQFWWKELRVAGQPLRVWQHEVHAVAHSRAGLRQQGFLPYGPEPHMFVRYSVYRDSPNKFSVVGLSADDSLRSYKERLFSSCLWLPETKRLVLEDSRGALSNPSTIIGEAKNRRGWGTHDSIYDTVVIECTFNETINGNGNGNGGFLFLQPNPPPPSDPDSDTLPAETLVQPMLVFHEEKFNKTLYENITKKKEESSFEVEYAHCGAPLHGNLLPDQVEEWYNYHYAFLEKKVHFFVYDVGGMKAFSRKVFSSLERAGALTLIDGRKQSLFDSFYFSQVLFLNDCLHRSRFLAKWIFNFDLDEYFVISPPQTLKSILNTAQDKHTVSFGSFLYTVRHCLEKANLQEWKVEHMVYREELPVCVRFREQYNDFEYGCEGTDGRRKWMMNPRMIGLTKVHAVNKVNVLDRKLENETFHVNAKVAWLGHFRQITLPPIKIHCRGGFHASGELDFMENGKYGVKGEGVKYVLDLNSKRIAEEARRVRQGAAVE